MKYDFLYDFPISQLGVAQLRVCTDMGSITRIIWLEQKAPERVRLSPLTSNEKKLKKNITLALNNYFRSDPIDSEISLCPQGTVFQKNVWRVLRTIPTGTVKTYGEIALELQTSSRAVGQACRRNNIPLFIPCHRVVATQGIGGFMGGYQYAERKRWLLQHEGIL